MAKLRPCCRAHEYICAIAQCAAEAAIPYLRDHLCSWFSRSQRQRQRFPAGDIRFGTLLFELASLHDLIDGLRNIGGVVVVTHALNVLCAKQHIGTKRHVAWVLHHKGEEFPEQPGIEGVDFLVLAPHIGLRQRPHVRSFAARAPVGRAQHPPCAGAEVRPR